jgi:hypothetical protein
MTSVAEVLERVEHDSPDSGLFIRRIINEDPGDWIPVFEDQERPGAEMFRFACLLTEERTAQALRDTNWELHTNGGAPGFVEHYSNGGKQAEYQAVGAEGVIPVVFHRTFAGGRPDVIELADDFRLFWDLYHERRDEGDRWLATDEAGDPVVVAEQGPGRVRIRKSFLRRYQAARQLHLSVQFNIDLEGGEELRATAEARAVEAGDDTSCIAYGGTKWIGEDGKFVARCIGKSLTPPPPVEQCKVWPFGPARSYENFIIGTDDIGNDIKFTCDSDALANYFGANPQAPHFLTPVFFKRAVLEKYYAEPDRYRVTDGYLDDSPLWGLPIDNGLGEHVAVFLGDLSRIPYREQAYWKSFNVALEEKMSDVAIRRSLLGEFADADRVEFRFSRAYTSANSAWTLRFGWPLFKDLHPGDEHVAHALHVPTNRGYAAFDTQLISLAKLVVDCLNEEDLGKNLTSGVKGEKGIAKLERFAQEQSLSASVDPLCAILRQVQGARSRSSAHRKGNDFNEILLLDGAPDLPTLFETMLTSLAEAFEQLSSGQLVAPSGPGQDAVTEE